jgi:iron complex outermembrane receptor protein
MSYTKNIVIALSLILTPIFSITAFSQEETASSRLSIEEIIVTGTKREIGQQDAAIAISTLTEQQVNNLFASDPRALGALVPNLTLTQQTGFHAIAGGMRGSGKITILLTDDPSLGFVVDEFGLNHVQSQFVEMFDIEQIEVFRGPQGTLFGKNSTAGVISITSKKAVIDEYSGEFSATAGQYDWNEGSKNKFKLALNVPIVEGKLAMRVAAIWDKDQGYFTNSKPAGEFPGPTVFNPTATWPQDRTPLVGVGDGGDLGGRDVMAAKIKFRYESESYSNDLIFEWLKDDSAAPGHVNESNLTDDPTILLPMLGFPGIGMKATNWGGNTWDNPLATGEPGNVQCNGTMAICKGHRVDATGIYFNQTWDLNNYTLKSITGWRTEEQSLASSYSGEAFISLYNATRNTKKENWQQEIRLSSDFDGPFNFTAGAVIAEETFWFSAHQTIGLQWFFGVPDYIHDDYVNDQAHQARKTTGVYFDFSYDINDDMTFSAGIRQTKDEKYFRKEQGAGAPNALGRAGNHLSTLGIDSSVDEAPRFWVDIPCENRNICLSSDNEWDEMTYRAALDYQWTEEVMVYVSYATGFIGGGTAETCSTQYSCSNPYNPETNESIEIGMKGDFLDNRLRLNVAIFNVEFEDLQRSQVVPLPVAPFQETVLINSGTSTNRGIEIELNYLITDNLRLDAQVATQDNKYDEFAWDELPNDGIDKVTDFSGLTLPFSPELSWGIGLTYDQDLSNNNGSITWNVNANYQDEADTSPGNLPRTQMMDYTLINAHATWRDIEDKYWFTVYGKNLGDEIYRTGANYVGGTWLFTSYGAPMEYGVEAGVRW